MSGSSNVVAMKKVVQQLRLEASVSRVKIVYQLSIAVLYGEHGSEAEWLEPCTETCLNVPV